MRNYEKGIIHEKGITLSDRERAWMQDMSKAESDRVLKLFKSHPNRKFDYRDTVRLTNIPKDNAKRSLSDLSQDDPNKKNYMDEWGQPPLIKLGERHKVMRVTASNRTIRVSTWTYNEDYGHEPQMVDVDEQGQSTMFGTPEPQHSGAYSGID